jgi:hypothetical protein
VFERYLLEIFSGSLVVNALEKDCHDCLLVQLSTERQYSGDSYFREQGFYSNKFTLHFPMDPNACLYYPSQPGDLPPSLAHHAESSQPMREAYLCPRGSSQPPSVQVQFHGSPAKPSGHQEKGHTDKRRLPRHQSIGVDSDSLVSDGQGGEQGFGFWPEFIYPVVTSPLLLSALSP